MVRKQRRAVRVHPIGLQDSEYLINTTNNQRDASIQKQSRENGPRTRRLSTTVIVESNDHDHKCGVCQAKLSASEVYNNTTHSGTKTLAPLCCKNCSTLNKPDESREGVEIDDGFDLWKSMKISRNPFYDMSQNTRNAWWDSIVEKKMNFLTSMQNYNTTFANDVDIEKKSNNVEESFENKDLNDVTSTSDQRQTKEEATNPKSDDKTDGGSMSRSLRARSKSPVRRRRKRSSLKLKVPTLKPVRPRSLSPRRKGSTAMGNQESAKNFSAGEKKTLSFGTTTVKFFNPETLPSQILDAPTFSIGKKKADTESDDTLVSCQPTAFPISPSKIRRDPTPLNRKVSPPKTKRTPTSKVAAATRIFVKSGLSSPKGVASRRAGCNDDKLSTIYPTKITIAENMDGKKKTRVMKSISPFFFKTDLAFSEHGAASSTKDVKKTHQLLCTSGRKPIDAAAIAKGSPSKGKTRKATIPRAHASSPDINLAPQYKLIPAPNLAKMDASQRRSHFGIANASSLCELKAEQLIVMAEECQSEGLISGSVVFGENTKELDLVKFMRKNVFEF
mmetsp:Transcript_27971/g.42342  ORF Transcript_27971/g.42342 Transcript_27971/m.42342 type:complete len:560 (-) Transcript_27971:65-1744(-)